MSSGSTTTDHDFIRKWAEERGGKPARVKGTESRDGSGILRIDFGPPEDSLELISWDDFFKTFEDRELAFLHQDKSADGETSRFFKFIHRRAGEADDTHKPGNRGRINDPNASKPAGDELKSREYRDDKGAVHHHTRTYMEQHEKE